MNPNATTKSVEQLLATAREALSEVILAKAPLVSRRSEADGYVVHVALADQSVLGFEYAEPRSTLADMSLFEMAYLATYGEPLGAEQRQELIDDHHVDPALLPAPPTVSRLGAR